MPGALHGVLRVVAVSGEQFLTAVSASAAVTASAPSTEQPLRLGLHVPQVAGMTWDEGLPEALEFLAFGSRKMTRAHSAIRIDGLPEAARRTNRLRE